MERQIDLDKLSYKVQMMKFNTDSGHADFIFKVIGPNGVIFQVIDRYSSMRSFQSVVKKNLDDSVVKVDDLPQFPKKKMFGTMDQAFLEARMTQLNQFFNAFLSNNQVARSNLVLSYFAQKAADKDSELKILQLNQQIQQAIEQEKLRKAQEEGTTTGGGQKQVQNAPEQNQIVQNKYEENTQEFMPMYNNQNFNHQKFHNDCKNIIDKIKERFIDLSPAMIEDEMNNSNYIDQIQEKQQAFKQEFEKKLDQTDPFPTNNGLFNVIKPCENKLEDNELGDLIAKMDQIDQMMSQTIAEVKDIEKQTVHQFDGSHFIKEI